MNTSRVRRETSPFFIPLSIASCTSRRPITGPAAPSSAITLRNATRPYCPRRYCPRRLRPVRLCGKELVSKQSLEVTVAVKQLERGSVFEDPPVGEHERPVRNLHRRQPLGRDEDGAAGDGRTEVVDEHPFRLGVDRRQRVVEDDDARARDERAGQRDA